MILHDYLRVLRRGWWVIALSTLTGLLVGLAASYLTPRTYYATATVYVSALGAETPGDLQQGNVFTTQRMDTWANLADTSSVLSPASNTLGGDNDVETLRESITATAREETSLIDISAAAPSAELAAARANTVADALTAEIGDLDTSGAVPSIQVTVVDPAVEPLIAATPQPRNNVLTGIAVGLALGVGIVVVAHSLDTRIRTAGDVPRSAGVASLTTVPGRRGRGGTGRVVFPARLEAFRNLRANLQFGAHLGRGIAVAGVTSGSDARGVADQLGAVLGEIGSEVVVVDVDLRPGDDGGRRARGVADAPVGPGIADVLRGDVEIDSVVTPGAGEHIFSIAAGFTDASSPQLLSTPGMRALMDTLTERFTYVILACPPLVERSESAVAAALAENSLVVVESGVTKRQELLFALELLRGVGVESISVVIDHVRQPGLADRF